MHLLLFNHNISIVLHLILYIHIYLTESSLPWWGSAKGGWRGKGGFFGQSRRKKKKKSSEIGLRWDEDSKMVCFIYTKRKKKKIPVVFFLVNFTKCSSYSPSFSPCFAVPLKKKYLRNIFFFSKKLSLQYHWYFCLCPLPHFKVENRRAELTNGHLTGGSERPLLLGVSGKKKSNLD